MNWEIFFGVLLPTAGMFLVLVWVVCACTRLVLQNLTHIKEMLEELAVELKSSDSQEESTKEPEDKRRYNYQKAAKLMLKKLHQVEEGYLPLGEIALDLGCDEGAILLAVAEYPGIFYHASNQGIIGLVSKK